MIPEAIKPKRFIHNSVFSVQLMNYFINSKFRGLFLNLGTLSVLLRLLSEHVFVFLVSA